MMSAEPSSEPSSTMSSSQASPVESITSFIRRYSSGMFFSSLKIGTITEKVGFIGVAWVRRSLLQHLFQRFQRRLDDGGLAGGLHGGFDILQAAAGIDHQHRVFGADQPLGDGFDQPA